MVAGVSRIGDLAFLNASLEPRASRRERLAAEIVVTFREQVERDERRRRVLGQHRDTRGGGVDAQRQQVEVEAVVGGDHDLTVDDRALGQVLAGSGR